MENARSGGVMQPQRRREWRMSLCTVLIVEKTENARRKPMDDFIVVHDGQEGRNDFTIVKRKDNMKD